MPDSLYPKAPPSLGAAEVAREIVRYLVDHSFQVAATEAPDENHTVWVAPTTELIEHLRVSLKLDGAQLEKWSAERGDEIRAERLAAKKEAMQ